MGLYNKTGEDNIFMSFQLKFLFSFEMRLEVGISSGISSDFMGPKEHSYSNILLVFSVYFRLFNSINSLKPTQLHVSEDALYTWKTVYQ